MIEGTAQSPATAKKLLRALEKVDRPGSFCASGSEPAILPGLNVTGMGPVGLPLTKALAKALERACEPAPYGKGKQTLVDTSVRRVFRLKPDRFSLDNPAWPGFLQTIVVRVQRELGLEQQQLHAHLYELLLYGPGGFFLPHRDGEKLDRMVATLVVVLPSKFEGGELLVRHEGQERSIDFSGPNGQFQVQFAAFYADCEHEVRPLRSGHRLCLIYNLVLARAKQPLAAPRVAGHLASVTGVLKEWSAQGSDPMKMAVTLEHQYSRSGLQWDALKGVDAARARILAEAAEQAGCQAHLALLTLHESGEADDMYYDQPSRGWYGRRSDDDEEETEGDGDEGNSSIAPQYKMGELLDRSLTATDWRTPADEPAELGEIPLELEEVVPPQSMTNVKPEEDFQGYTGNEGMPLDRWYRRAAVVLWPQSRHLDVLCQAGARESLPALARMIASIRSARDDAAASLRAHSIQFAQKILAAWPVESHRSWRPVPRDPAAGPGLGSLLQTLGDPKLIGEYLSQTLVRDVRLDPGLNTVKAIADQGWEVFDADLRKLFAESNEESLERNARFLEQLCSAAAKQRGSKASGARAATVCEAAGDALLGALQGLDASPKSPDWRSDEVDRAATLASVLRGLLGARLDGLIAKVLAHVQANPARYGLREVQLPVVAKLPKSMAAVPRSLLDWLGQCRVQLEELTAQPPQPPADFRRDANFSCKCGDCEEMRAFLRDPVEQQRGFQIAQARRRHLEERVSRLDVVCRTDKRPRPQVLICTKNTATYDRQLKRYRKDLDELAMLRSLEAELAATKPGRASTARR